MILEKPIALSSTNFENIRNSPNFKDNKLRFSRVWNYSDIWRKFRTLTLGEISRIQIKRGGPDHGSTIPLAQDWAPHDIYLLADLIGKNFLDLEIERIKSSRVYEHGLIQVLNPKIEISYEFGQFKETRVAEWLVQSELRGLVKLNFLNQEILFEDGESWKKEGKSDAITRMFLEFENVQKHHNILAFNAQELFWNKVFEFDLFI